MLKLGKAVQKSATVTAGDHVIHLLYRKKPTSIIWVVIFIQLTQLKDGIWAFTVHCIETYEH